MKLAPAVTNLDRRNTATLKKIDGEVVSTIYDVITIFQSMIDLEQLGTRLPDTWSMILRFSLIGNFCLTKSENRTKKSIIDKIY